MTHGTSMHGNTSKDADIEDSGPGRIRKHKRQDARTASSFELGTAVFAINLKKSDKNRVQA